MSTNFKDVLSHQQTASRNHRLTHEIMQVYWHSSAHILGEALERHVGGCLCYGPPIENGFYYDTYLGEQ